MGKRKISFRGTEDTCRGGPSRRCDDAGATLVESLIILPLFLVFLFGILEGGRLLMVHQTARAATSVAARQAAIRGTESTSDFRILQSLQRATVGRIEAGELDRIIVFNASIAGQPNRFLTEVPASCLSGPVAGLCNVYTGADFNLSEGDLATCASPSKARHWCPADRKSASLDTDGNGPPDWIGIYIQGDLPMVTSLFGDSITITDTRIARIEATRLR